MRKNIGPVLKVSGIDMMDGTPIYDIKPYLPHIDAIGDAKGGFAENVKDYSLEVCFDNGTESELGEEANVIRKILSNDPRPSYQNNPEMVYGMEYCGYNIRFWVKENIVHIINIEK